MDCCEFRVLETRFDRARVARKLVKYRSDGPVKETRMLVDALKSEGIEGCTLLDIGGGIGGIQHELLKAGVVQATNVEASLAYIEASMEEAAREGLADRVTLLHGDFVALAPEVPSADIVTLDRVICCYRDADALVGLSCARANRLYGVVYPREEWWTRLDTLLRNAISRIKSDPFRLFVHPTKAIDTMVRANGLRPRFQRKTLYWQVVVYGR
jgi:tRNA1(Val) A37 N6-methylase TrmN6